MNSPDDGGGSRPSADELDDAGEADAGAGVPEDQAAMQPDLGEAG
jgi:hypothetical protein